MRTRGRPQLTVADLRRLIAGCEAQQQRYAAAGFYPMDQLSGTEP